MAFATHALCPYIYAAGNSDAGKRQLAAFLAQGAVRGLDIACPGDSRFTSPTGAGQGPIAALNEIFASLVPSGYQEIMPWQTQSSSGGGSPPAGYSCIMNTNGQGTLAFNSTATGNRLPGNFNYYKPNNNAGGGDMKLYLPDAVNCIRTMPMHGGGSKFFDITQPTYIDSLVMNADGAVDPSNLLRMELRANANTTLTWAGTLLGGANVPVTELNQAGLKCVKYSAGPYNNNGSPYYATNIRLSSALVGANNLSVIASRIRLGQGRGIAFTPMGIGGVTVQGILTNADTAGQGSMFNAGVALAAMNPDAFMHIVGQNDAGGSVSAANLKIHLANCINTFRSWMGKVVPYIILNNPQNSGLGTVNAALESSYAQPITELCDELPEVYFINIERFLNEKWGWNDTSCPQGATTLGAPPAPFVHMGEWNEGASYTAGVSLVCTDGANGVALTTNTPVGTFRSNEVVTQATSGAAGYFISEISGTVFLRQIGTTAFNGTNALTGGTSGATRNVSAVRGDGLYRREYNDAAGADNPQDIIPRRYWVAEQTHTGVWNRRPGSISRDTQGHTYWRQVYSFYDLADLPHWHGLGSYAVASAVGDIVMDAGFNNGSLGGMYLRRGR